MQPFHAWHLPHTAGADLPADDLVPTFDSAAGGSPDAATGGALRVPRLAAADVERICLALRDAGARLRQVPLDEVVSAIDHVAGRFLDPADDLRAAALAWLPRTTGYAPAMARLVLDRMAADWRAPELRALLRAELRDVRVLDRFIRHRPGQYVRAFGPRLSFHIIAGNVPGVGVTSLVRSLLVRAPALCKTARDEPVLPVLFARALHEHAPALGAALAVAWWPGGQLDLEAAALAHADVVVHYGGPDALASLAPRVPPHARLLEHGPRISFGVVAREKLHDPELPAHIARATAVFDQQGCVSPHLVYIEESRPGDARTLAGKIAGALADLGLELSRGRITPGEATAIHAARAAAEFRTIGGADVAVWGDSSLGYTVIYEPGPDFRASCLHRTLWCRPISDLAQVPALVAPHAPLLQSVAVAAPKARKKALAGALGAAGATRITCFETLPWPSQTWHHDGRGPLRELIRFVDFEPG
jgi:hypothetical protein